MKSSPSFMWIENNFEPHLQRSNWLKLNPELGYKFWKVLDTQACPTKDRPLLMLLGHI